MGDTESRQPSLIEMVNEIDASGVDEMNKLPVIGGTQATMYPTAEDFQISFGDKFENFTDTFEFGEMDNLFNTGVGVENLKDIYTMYSAMMGPNSDVFDAKVELLNQQIDSNKQARADTQKFNKTMADASNGVMAKQSNSLAHG